MALHLGPELSVRHAGLRRKARMSWTMQCRNGRCNSTHAKWTRVRRDVPCLGRTLEAVPLDVVLSCCHVRQWERDAVSICAVHPARTHIYACRTHELSTHDAAAVARGARQGRDPCCGDYMYGDSGVVGLQASGMNCDASRAVMQNVRWIVTGGDTCRELVNGGAQLLERPA